MKILKNEGKFEVLSKTDDVIFQIANAARICYKSFDKQSPENDLKLVKNLLNRNHFAMIEFGDMTVKFTQISRGVTHELVRHRLCSYAQESTRYVNESDLHVVVPPHKDETMHFDVRNCDGDVIYGGAMNEHFENVEKMYKTLLKAGYKPEDARQVLPIATEAPICIKANLRQWRQIFKMRCDKFAHWEIRKVMLDLLKYCQANIPLIFDDYHFFMTDDGKEYARPVMPENVLMDEIKHYLLSNLDVNTAMEKVSKGQEDTGLNEINNLINFIRDIESKFKKVGL